MKKLIFGFSKPKNLTFKPFAKIIMAVDNINYDHGYIRFPSASWETSFIYQSSGSRTNFMSQQLFDKINETVEEYEIEVEETNYNKIGALCVSREGLPYPVGQIIGIGLIKAIYYLTHGNVHIKKNPFSSGYDQPDCIEEQAKILKDGLGIHTPFDMDVITVKPFRDWLAILPQMTRIK